MQLFSKYVCFIFFMLPNVAEESEKAERLRGRMSKNLEMAQGRVEQLSEWAGGANVFVVFACDVCTKIFLMTGVIRWVLVSSFVFTVAGKELRGNQKGSLTSSQKKSSILPTESLLHTRIALSKKQVRLKLDCSLVPRLHCLLHGTAKKCKIFVLWLQWSVVVSSEQTGRPFTGKSKITGQRSLSALGGSRQERDTREVSCWGEMAVFVYNALLLDRKKCPW